MNASRLLIIPATVGLLIQAPSSLQGQLVLRQLKDSPSPHIASLEVHTGERSPYRVPRDLTGKFAEHLGFNIYHGMNAQILRNPTFAVYPFATGRMSPNGKAIFLTDDARVSQRLRQAANRFGWPEQAADELGKARRDGLASWWIRQGPREEVRVSPDTGPFGGRAQRIQLDHANQGIAQWTWLPLHRIRRFAFDLFARAPHPMNLALSLSASGSSHASVTVPIHGLVSAWHHYKGNFVLPDTAPAGQIYKLALTGGGPGQFVLAHLFLYPADSIHGADPDIIRFLKASHLPILRWPGGNFSSTYHWRDGIGPVDRRPTLPNEAWGRIEPNLFGTDEYMEFCRAVGCQPMICINGGTGTPQEAADWVEYCNGPATSPMGKLRAADGHPEPYRVQYWEVGNELWGHWQDRWTTPSGYVDRYLQFARAMRAVDPHIHLLACGAPVLWGKSWNHTLIQGAASKLKIITDHPLIGGTVSPAMSPRDIFRDFMDVPEILQKRWAGLDQEMQSAGISHPGLAVTELQMFAHLHGRPNPNAPARLTPDNLVTPATLAEGLYDVLIYHAAIRLAPFVVMVTHSAVVNHGGGLRKEREQVYANPCYYAQSMFSAFAGATPVAVTLTTPQVKAPMLLPDVRHAAAKEVSYGEVDAMAALARDGSLLLSVVHRGLAHPIDFRVRLDRFHAGPTAHVRTLTGKAPWARNSLDHPNAIHPADSTLPIENGTLRLNLPPCSVVRVSIPSAAAE